MKLLDGATRKFKTHPTSPLYRHARLLPELHDLLIDFVGNYICNQPKPSVRTSMALISQLFGDETFDPFLSLINKCPVLNTPTDWKETPEAHVFKADLPGLKKEEVKVEVDDERVLQISGERKVEEDDKNEKSHRVERCKGKFLRRFRLPENTKANEVKASMEDGVLTVVVPKQEVKKPQRKVIQIEGN